MEHLRYVLGLVTLAVVSLAGWYLFSLLTDDDLANLFHVQLTFEDVRGLRPGADVRYRGVRVGQVTGVSVSGEGAKAQVELVLNEGYDELARVRSKFWIVSPRFEGLTGGATGLDTLVRDSYVAFLSPRTGTLLAPHSHVAGLERPFVNPDEAGLDPIRHGDLAMYLHAPESHGLRVGGRVRFRGIDTGDIRHIELADDGTHVVLTLRIEQAFRHTITDATRFWVARPRVSGALISGLSVEDLNALLTPFIGYHTGAKDGVPVPDGFRTIAREVRPAFEDAPFSIPASPDPAASGSGEAAGARIVGVIYEAVEEDWFSPNDRLNLESSGVLFIDPTGRAVVVTARSACDAAFTMRDMFGSDPDIQREAIRIAIPGGTVLRAGRSWVDPDGRDIALIVIEEAPPDLDATPAELFDFATEADLSSQFELRGHIKTNATVTADTLPVVDTARGDLATRAGRVFGVLGQRSGLQTGSTIVPIGLLPAELRPGQ